MRRATYARPSRLDRLGRADRIVIAILVLGPILVYAPMSIAGHPPLPGDDLLQNYPLRVLSGQLLASGRLPVWDPFIWSGTPLLGGWNAGAMFPGTWLFAFMNPIAAWTINYCSVPIAASLGMYAFGRYSLRLRPIPSLAGAIIFTYTGFVSGQNVHIGLEQGTAVLPWILLGVDGIAAATTRRRRFGFGLLVATGLALCVLAGDPRAVTTAALLLLVYLVAHLVRAPRAGLRTARDAILAAALGAAASAVQWLPGLGFVRSSQRGANAYVFYGAGSLSEFHQVVSFALPFLSGSAGNFGLAGYEGPFNLPETTVGVGLVALVAALAFLPELLACALEFLRRRASPRVHVLGVWFVLAGLGSLLATGSTTGFGNVLFHIPLFGGERLQNRNLVLTDLALAVLLGLFLEDLLAGASSPHPARPPWWHREALPARLLAVLPSCAAVLLIVLAFVKRADLEFHLGFEALLPDFFHQLEPYLIPAGILAVVVALLVLAQRRLAPRLVLSGFLVLTTVDAATYIVNSSVATTPTSVIAGPTSTSRAVARLIGNDTRFAIFNPATIYTPYGANELYEAGETDLNIIQQNPSVQGYGSIVDGDYDNATGLHTLESADTTRLSTETFNTLDLGYLLTFPLYIDEAIAAHAQIPVMVAPGVSTIGAAVPTTARPGPGPRPGGPWPIAAGTTEQFILPSPTKLIRATVVLTTKVDASLEVAASGVDTRAHFVAGPIRAGTFTERLVPQAGTTVLEIHNPTRATLTVGAVVVITARPNSQRLLLSGALQGALDTPQWVYAGTLDHFLVFKNTETRGFGWLQPRDSRFPDTAHLAPGTVSISAGSPIEPQRFVVDSPQPAQLVRSEAFEPGWHATLTSEATGRSVDVGVHRFGLVQAIYVPAGRYLVSWHYSPGTLVISLAASAAGSALVVAGTVWLTLTTLRRRREVARAR